MGDQGGLAERSGGRLQNVTGRFDSGDCLHILHRRSRRGTIRTVRRTLAAALLGMVLGVLGTLAGVELAGRNEYYYLTGCDEVDVSRFVNELGWQIVPGQPNRCYLMRSRLRLR